MARQQSSGAGGAIAGLVVFAFLWVITLVVLIVYINKADDAEKRATNEAAKTAKFASNADQSNEVIIGLDAKANNTVVSQLLGTIAELQKVITGAEGDDIATIQDKVQFASENVDSVGLLSVADPHASLLNSIKELVNNFQAAQTTIAAEKARVATMEGELSSAQVANEAIGVKFQETEAGLLAQLDQVKVLAEAYRAQAEGKVGDLDGLLQKVREDTDGQMAAKDDVIAGLEKIITDLKIIQAQKELEGGKNAPEAWRQADGKIASLLERSDYVYIDIGENQNLLAGTTFAVYDKELGVEASADGLNIGKAKIEVITVNANASVARVVELARGEVIQPGDLIANVVFDSKATNKFHVFGDFDIDNDGNAGLVDKRRIEGMILRSEGELKGDISPDIDFLVLGVEPDLPEPLDPDDFDPIRIAAHEAAKQKYDRYYELVGRAAELSVPILNQNRFLYLTGYYRR